MKQMKKLLSVLLVVCMIFSLACTAMAAQRDESLDGKVVILHSNDVHGAIDGYARMAGLRDQYTAAGADVILADAGDYSQGSTYVSVSKGANAIEMMNAVGYDVATLGNHEFDFGYDNLMANLKNATFKPICGDAFKDGKSILDGWTIIEREGVKVGFVGLETPETATKVNPGLIQGITFPQKAELYACAQSLTDEVKAAGADVVIGLWHLGVDAESVGNRSADVLNHVTGVDFVIDGHSHTVMTPGDGGEFSSLSIQSTGTKFANIGAIVIDPATKSISASYLVPVDDSVPANETVKAKSDEIMAAVDAEYGAVFARSEVELNGAKAPNGNRDSETNHGDFITDAMLWSVLRGGDVKMSDGTVIPKENIVAITNGGGIRAAIKVGDVTMKDINTVLPFGNVVTVVFVKGSELLEALEASTFCTPKSGIGGFPQIAGMNITVAAYKDFDQGAQYPNSTYYGPKSIQRVTVDDVNGKPFDETATYAVVTNDFCSAGGDTYFVFKAAADRFDTSVPMDEAVIEYVKEELSGVIGAQYAEPQGRIKIVTEPPVEPTVPTTPTTPTEPTVPVEPSEPTEPVVPSEPTEPVVPSKPTEPTTPTTPPEPTTVEPCDGGDKCPSKHFKDVDHSKDSWYHIPVDWAVTQDPFITDGIADDAFGPKNPCLRCQVVTFLWRAAKCPEPTTKECPFTDVKETDYFYKAVLWAYENKITDGMTETTFGSNDTCTREQFVTFLWRFEKEPAPTIKDNPFKDVGENYAYKAILWAYENKITDGVTEDTFGPKDLCTRAHVVTFLYRDLGGK